jgi:hypothetical protein
VKQSCVKQDFVQLCNSDKSRQNPCGKGSRETGGRPKSNEGRQSSSRTSIKGNAGSIGKGQVKGGYCDQVHQIINKSLLYVP